jgi:membrane protein
LLSLAPLVILAIAAGGLFFGGTVTEQHLIQQVQQWAGSEAAHVVEVMAEQARKSSSGGVASIVGLLTILVAASGVFAELRAALNTMWDIQPRWASGGFLGMIKEKLLSIGMVLAIGFLLVVSLTASAVLAALGKFFGEFLPVPVPVLDALNFLISFVGIAVMFALVLRYVPDARLPWRYLWVGAGINALCSRSERP